MDASNLFHYILLSPVGVWARQSGTCAHPLDSGTRETLFAPLKGMKKNRLGYGSPLKGQELAEELGDYSST